MATDAESRREPAPGPPPLRRSLAPLAAAVLLLGIADSMVGSYIVLFATDVAGLNPVQVGVLASAPAVGGIAVSWLLGRRSTGARAGG